MTEISFYHLQRQTLEQALPKLLERAMEAGYRAVVLAETRERVEELDNILWTYDPNSFLAHGTDRDEFSADQPIYLTQEDENPNEADVIVLVDERVPSDMSRYKRCLDLFDGRDPSAVEAARGRWKSWKAEGHAVTYWQQKEQGGWEKAG